MWSREIIKSNAKAAIRGKKFWIAFLMVAVLVVLPIVLEKVSGYDKINDDLTNAILYQTPMPESGLVMGYNLGFVLLTLLVVIPLSVGLNGFFVRNRFDAGKPSDLLLAFHGGYGNVVITSFVTNLFIILWALLLIVPGIIKGIQYSMVPFLLSDNPSLSGKRVREISRKMTDGEKGSIFVLMLSFIGWFLLPILVSILISLTAIATPGLDVISYIIVQVGTLMVMVYYYATFAELYIYLRDRAIQTGMVQPEELNLAN